MSHLIGDDGTYSVPEYEPEDDHYDQVGGNAYNPAHSEPNQDKTSRVLPPEDKTPPKDPRNVAGYLVASSGEKIFLSSGINVLGRGKSDHNLMQDLTISHRHCVVEVDTSGGFGDFRYLLYDIGAHEGKESKNGVFVFHRTVRLGNNEKVVIYDGTQFEIGRTFLTLHANT